MLRLFRHKMVSVVKYFRRNHFMKNSISRKYFSTFGSHKKITKSENATVAVVKFRRTCLARFGHIRLDCSHFGQIRPVSYHGWIPARFCWNLVLQHPATVAGCRRIPVPLGFRRSTIAEFWQSDMKHACNDEKYNFGKLNKLLGSNRK
jgi:hypothetical protein